MITIDEISKMKEEDLKSLSWEKLLTDKTEISRLANSIEQTYPGWSRYMLGITTDYKTPNFVTAKFLLFWVSSMDAENAAYLRGLWKMFANVN